MPEEISGEVSLAADATLEAADSPDPRSIWVFDHEDECGNLIRMMFQSLAGFLQRSRGECPTCMQALPAARPATAEDW